MKFNTYLGKPIKGAYENYLERAKEAKEPENRVSPLSIKVDINPSDYIAIPNTNTIIARQETNKGKNWTDTHYALAENGLFMPTPKIFIYHFMNVREAAKGKITLYGGNNSPIPRDEIEELWKYLSTNYNNGCWTWLDAKFSQENDVWKITYNHKVTQKGKDKSLQGKTETLEDCIREDCYVNLDFNNQGLPLIKSKKQDYKQGENIYYWHPRNSAVAWFWASSVRAGLYCDWGPGGSNSSLGVFSCAAGAPKN